LAHAGNAWAAKKLCRTVHDPDAEPKKYDRIADRLAHICRIARNRVMKHLERLPRELPLEEQ